MSALDLSLEAIIKQRAKPAQKTAKAKPRRAAARGGGKKKTVVRKKTAGKRPRDARGSIFDRLGNADGAKTVEVRNVPYDVLESELRRLFEACGTIKACRMALDASGRSLGRATITFANPREAQAARTRYDGETLDGRALEVRLATARPGTRGGGAAPTGNVREGLFGTALAGLGRGRGRGGDAAGSETEARKAGAEVRLIVPHCTDPAQNK